MTVSYQYDVASSASGGFIRLLFRWRGSVWKVVYREMLLFTVCYVLLAVLYQFVLAETQQKIFEKIVYFCSTFMDLIPLSFMLGFYVSFIAARWWSQFIAIPWPDKLMNIIAMYVPGLDEASRVVRRTLMRYLNLSLVLVLRSISMAVKRRFPTKEHLVEAEFNTFWIPCTWFINVLREARQECRITDSNGLKLIMEELNEFRSKCGLLWGYDWISIPLVYTQVVTMATYAFYVACMFGRQNVSSSEPGLERHRYDYHIPIFTLLQLMFYMGLLKVAEQLINPFGDDDEDFELNWIIDRHMKVSYLGVDTLNGTPPPLVKDTYYNELDVKIPYTEASRSYKKKTYRGSVAYMQVPMEQQGMVVPDMSDEDDDGGETASCGEMGPRRLSMYSLFHGKDNKGSSPAGSFCNLDNASLDSEWKCSLLNINAAASPDSKNASGTLGNRSADPFVIDMSKAEDDEIVLQEVVIDPTHSEKVSYAQTDNLKAPGMSRRTPEKKASSLLNVLRDVSPKIAPKFPREKLKSMFRKNRKMSMSVPFYKVKGVRFSRDTKDSQETMEESESLLSIQDETPVEVEITLSNPELTEIEKRLGAHPYNFDRQRTTCVGTASSPRSKARLKPSSQNRRSSHDSRAITEDITPLLNLPPTRSISLPNIQSVHAPKATTEMLMSSLKKFAAPKKEKFRKVRKKSPPPPTISFIETEIPSDKDTQSDIELDENQSLERRNTLPQITLTRYDQKSPEHLDLATSVSSSGHSSEHSSDSGAPTTQLPPVASSSIEQIPKTTQLSLKDSSTNSSPQSLRLKTRQASIESAESSIEDPQPSSLTESSKQHSTSPVSQKPPLKPSLTRTFHQNKVSPLPSTSAPPSQKPSASSSTSLQHPSPSPSSSTSSRRSPQKSLSFAKTGLTLPLKTSKTSSSAASDSAPSSPTRTIASVVRSPSFPKALKSSRKKSPPPPLSRPEIHSPLIIDSRPPLPPSARAQRETGPITPTTTTTTQTAGNSCRRDNQSNRQPEPPQRHMPKKANKGRK